VPFAKDMFKDVIEVREVDEQLGCLFNKVMIECWNGLLLDGRNGSWEQCFKRKKKKKKIYNFKISKVPNFWLKKTISHFRSMFLNFSPNTKITNQQKIGHEKGTWYQGLARFVYTIELYKEKFKP
jgi:hypothetical protein